MTTRPWNIAVVGAGPAGVFTADLLTQQLAPLRVDLFERLPVPFGLVRYGIAPDHPNITTIGDPLHTILDRGDIRLVAGVDIGTDVGVEQLRAAYDAVVLTTGADQDAPLSVPGADLPGSFGASQLVSWYNAHPDAPRTWSLDAEQVAVIGAGNVALDITRMLAKHADDLVSTQIPDEVLESLRSSRVRDVHVFARRGPAEAQFSPFELRRLDQLTDVDVIVDPEDLVLDRSSEVLMAGSPQRRTVVTTLQEWSERDRSAMTASRRVHLHFMQAAHRIDGTEHVDGLTVERTRHLVNGTVEGTGEYRDYPVGQVYRAVGYASRAVPGIPFDTTRRRVPHDQGRVLGPDRSPLPGLYVSGWIKRGPTGLVGSTRSDSRQTVNQLVADAESWTAGGLDRDPLPELLEAAGLRGIDWDGWLRVDRHERALGAEQERPRTKVAARQRLAQIALGMGASGPTADESRPAHPRDP